MVEYRCLRCGATVGGTKPAASTVHGPAAPDREPQPAGIGVAMAMPAPVSNGAAPADVDAGEGEGERTDGLSALAALRELGELHAAGILTDEEFAAKKAELLRRV
jgi:hypothetical protein